MNSHQVRELYLSGLKRLIPGHMRGGVCRYMEDGIQPGNFLSLMLIGDRQAAMGCVDYENLVCMGQWETFLGQFLPVDAHGSTLRFAHWRHMGGLNGVPDFVTDMRTER